MLTVREAIDRYLAAVADSRSAQTHKAYRQACSHFVQVLDEHDIAPATTPIESLSPEWIGWTIHHLRAFAVATEQLTLTALFGFYEHVAAEGWSQVNLPTVRQLIRRRQRRQATRLPDFPQREIAVLLDYVNLTVAQGGFPDEGSALRALRDRALIFVLADTGLRVAEACSLTRGHLDWHEGRAIVLGKGNREAVVRFSERSLRLARLYLETRAPLDGRQGKPLRSLPLFARHDRGAGQRVLPLSPRSAEKIVEEWGVAALGEEARGRITPHTFRHHFVTTVLRASGGNIRLAQELARHRTIATTERYVHLSDDELDRGYHDIFDG